MPNSFEGIREVANPTYYHQGEVDPLDLMYATGDDRGFAKGSVLKYVHRHESKGSPSGDLLKALFYLGWLIGVAAGRDCAGRRKIAIALVDTARTLVEVKP